MEFQKVGGWFVENDWKETDCGGTIVLITVERIIIDNRKKMEYICLLMSKELELKKMVTEMMEINEPLTCTHKHIWMYVYHGKNKILHSNSKVTLLVGRRYADSLSYELNRRVSSTPFKDQKQEKLDGCSGKVEMACTRLAAAMFSSSPEMDERKAAHMKALS
ncbi:Nuclear transport factor [Trichinella spiralis]|uniref:Nuclear transport factor n=1 Tax=Trichinella spiralis TaxID=6334 RepID=A0ABR3K2R6_TRISP